MISPVALNILNNAGNSQRGDKKACDFAWIIWVWKVNNNLTFNNQQTHKRIYSSNLIIKNHAAIN